MLPKEKLELCKHTRVNIECDMLLISCAKAISINEICLCGHSVCSEQAAPFLWSKLTGSVLELLLPIFAMLSSWRKKKKARTSRKLILFSHFLETKAKTSA